jgi:hypothetical protein
MKKLNDENDFKMNLMNKVSLFPKQILVEKI